MKKMICFEESEFNEKLLYFVNNFIKQMDKGYGISIISNETKQKIIDKDTICGAFYLIWNETFKINKG